MRLIDADRLKEFIDDNSTVLPELIQYNRTEVLRMIDQGRIVAAKPIKCGHWKRVEQREAERWGGRAYIGTPYCSECNWSNTYRSNYCPNCGAKMDGVLKL